MRARAKIAGVLALSVALAGALTVSGARLASSQGAVLTALRTEEKVPANDPYDPFWRRVPSVEVALSAQQVTPPKGGSRLSLTARAVNDGTNLYVLAEWPDEAPDRAVSGSAEFTDSVAVQFPSVASQQVPALCMGDPSAHVNVWQWRAASQADVNRGFQGDVLDRYPRAVSDDYPFRDDDVFYPGRHLGNPLSQTARESAVDNLVAGGFGSLTPDPWPALTGWGGWRDGKWRVVFSRPLQADREGSVSFGPTDVSDVAFAVWDGEAGERDGIKSVANFMTLRISMNLMESASRWPYWPLPFFAFIAAWIALGWLLTSRRRARAAA